MSAAAGREMNDKCTFLGPLARETCLLCLADGILRILGSASPENGICSTASGAGENRILFEKEHWSTTGILPELHREPRELEIRRNE